MNVEADMSHEDEADKYRWDDATIKSDEAGQAGVA
jgi:hypothetical protein